MEEEKAMLRSARHQRLRAVVLWVGGVVIIVVLLAGILRDRVQS